MMWLLLLSHNIFACLSASIETDASADIDELMKAASYVISEGLKETRNSKDKAAIDALTREVVTIKRLKKAGTLLDIGHYAALDGAFSLVLDFLNEIRMIEAKAVDPLRPVGLINNKKECVDNAVILALSSLDCFNEAVTSLDVDNPLAAPLRKFIEERETMAITSVDIQKFTAPFVLPDGGKSVAVVASEIIQKLPLLEAKTTCQTYDSQGAQHVSIIQSVFPQKQTSLEDLLDSEPIERFPSKGVHVSNMHLLKTLQFLKPMWYPDVLVVLFNKVDSSFRVGCPLVIRRVDSRGYHRRYILKAAIVKQSPEHVTVRLLGKNRRWYLIDDARVIDIRAHEVIDEKVVMVFYERADSTRSSNAAEDK